MTISLRHAGAKMKKPRIAVEGELADGRSNLPGLSQRSHPPRLQVRACTFASKAHTPFAFVLLQRAYTDCMVNG